MISSKDMRRRILELAIKSGNNHIASAMSIVEILIAVYSMMTKDDKFILSKGHGCLALYAMLESLGYKPELKHHPDIDVANGITCTTGSLGHGLPIAVGMAMGLKIQDKPGNIYVLMGDGECQEGTTWESCMLAAHYQLNNLIAIVDRNGKQALDDTERVCALGDLWQKFTAFDWDCCESDGHVSANIIDVMRDRFKHKPFVLIANTIKGKGIPYMEDKPEWHAKMPSAAQFSSSFRELVA